MTQLNELDHALVDLFGDDIFAIGGSVRDGLINQFFGTDLTCKDFDFTVVGKTLDDVQAIFASVGARIDAVGASFAVLKVTLNGVTIDVSLPRRESSTGEGHRDFSVDFGPEVSLEDDQARRDLTINAISRQLSTGKILALPGALDDLENGIIRVISSQSFVDDPLRILRAVQFASRFGFEIEPETRSLILEHAGRLASISAERINEELQKLLVKSPKPSVGIRLLVELGLMEFVMPELLESVGVEQNIWHTLDVFGHLCLALDSAAEDGGDLIDLLAALLHDVGKPRTCAVRPDGQGNSFHGHEDVGADMVVLMLRRLRFSEEIVNTVESLVRNHMFPTCGSDSMPFSDAAVRRLIRRITPDLLERQFALREADMRGSGTDRGQRRDLVNQLRTRMFAMLAEVPALDVKALAINGSDVIAHFISEGIAPAGFRGDRRVGTALNALLERVLDDPNLNERERLLGALATIS